MPFGVHALKEKCHICYSSFDWKFPVFSEIAHLRMLYKSTVKLQDIYYNYVESI